MPCRSARRLFGLSGLALLGILVTTKKDVTVLAVSQYLLSEASRATMRSLKRCSTHSEFFFKHNGKLYSTCNEIESEPLSVPIDSQSFFALYRRDAGGEFRAIRVENAGIFSPELQGDFRIGLTDLLRRWQLDIT